MLTPIRVAHTLLPNDTVPDDIWAAAYCWDQPGLPCRYEPWGHFAARSRHPGGVNAGFADGSVRFVAEGVSLRAWNAAGTRDGGEAEEVP